MSDLLESHKKATINKCSKQDIVLVAQMATEFNLEAVRREYPSSRNLGGNFNCLDIFVSAVFNQQGPILGCVRILKHNFLKSSKKQKL